MRPAQLLHFLTLASELHFGRAAKRAGIAQPALSQSIRRLEKQLDATLFDRSARRVRLTAAGKALQTTAPGVIQHARLAETVVRRTASGHVAKLSIGYVNSSLNAFLPRALQTFTAKWPDITVTLEELPTKPQLHAIREGALDAGIVQRIGLLDYSDLRWLELERTPIGAVVPASSPLAKRRQLKLTDLAPYPIILSRSPGPPGIHASTIEACHQAGFEPNIKLECRNGFAILQLVGHELGVSLMPRTAARIGIPGLRFIPISDIPATLSSVVGLCWFPDAESPGLKNLIKIFQDLTGKGS